MLGHNAPLLCLYINVGGRRSIWHLPTYMYSVPVLLIWCMCTSACGLVGVSVSSILLCTVDIVCKEHMYNVLCVLVYLVHIVHIVHRYYSILAYYIVHIMNYCVYIAYI